MLALLLNWLLIAINPQPLTDEQIVAQCIQYIESESITIKLASDRVDILIERLEAYADHYHR